MTGLLPAREQFAMIIDPLAWRTRARHLERAIHWQGRPEVPGADSLAISFERDAENIIKPSLAKAEEILSVMEEMTDDQYAAFARAWQEVQSRALDQGWEDCVRAGYAAAISAGRSCEDAHG